MDHSIDPAAKRGVGEKGYTNLCQVSKYDEFMLLSVKATSNRVNNSQGSGD